LKQDHGTWASNHAQVQEGAQEKPQEPSSSTMSHAL
jgi:hypothetical protein